MGATFPPDSVGLVVARKLAIDQPLALDCGRTLPRFDLMVETYGELNAARSNAVLVCHALSADHHAAGFHAPHPGPLPASGERESSSPKPGWWDNCIGPGKPLDT